MTQARTAEQIVAAAKELADMDQPGTGPTFVDAAEGLERVNEAIGALWDLLVAEGAEELLYKTDIQSGTVAPSWPGDLLRLVSIEVKTRGRWVPLDRSDLRDEGLADASDDAPTHYMMGNAFGTNFGIPVAIPVYPPRAGGATFDYRIRYVPEPSEVANINDDIVLPNRWATWVKYEVAIHFLAKEESDTSVLERRQAKVESAIVRAAARTDLAGAHKLRLKRRRGRDRRHPRGGWWGMP